MPFPTQYARSGKTSFSNADLERPKLKVETVSPMQGLASREGISDVNPLDALLASANRTLGSANQFSSEVEADTTTNPMQFPAAEVDDSVFSQLWDVATLNPEALGLTGNAANRAQLASTVMPTGMAGAAGLGFKALAGMGRLAGPAVGKAIKTGVGMLNKPKVVGHLEGLEQGRQKALEALKGFDILKAERGVPKPSPAYAKQMKQHAAGAEGIPSAYTTGPRGAERISHLSQLPEEREITAEQLWKYMDPSMLDQLAKMFGL